MGVIICIFIYRYIIGYNRQIKRSSNMIPNEEDIREYAKYATRVREIVQEEMSKSTEKIDPNLLG